MTFGALGPDGKELLRFERKSKSETEVYLKKELDREVRRYRDISHNYHSIY